MKLSRPKLDILYDLAHSFNVPLSMAGLGFKQARVKATVYSNIRSRNALFCPGLCIVSQRV